MEWIDTHCHMDHRQFSPDRQAVLENARRLGMAAMIVPAITLESNRMVREDPLLDRDGIWLAVGVHPNHVEPGLEWEMLEGFLDSRTVAIGEIGLDYFRTRDPEKQALQRQMFRLQLELAINRDLPVILHVRDAWDDALDILKSHGKIFSGAAHCFAGTWQQAQEFMALGFALGIGGVVTRGNADLVETVKNAPAEMLLLETDAPFLAPKGCKGRNTPENIPVIAQTVAHLRGEDIKNIMSTTTENARRVFRLK